MRQLFHYYKISYCQTTHKILNFDLILYLLSETSFAECQYQYVKLECPKEDNTFFKYFERYKLSFKIRAKGVGVKKDNMCVLKIQDTLLL